MTTVATLMKPEELEKILCLLVLCLEIEFTFSVESVQCVYVLLQMLSAKFPSSEVRRQVGGGPTDLNREGVEREEGREGGRELGRCTEKELGVSTILVVVILRSIIRIIVYDCACELPHPLMKNCESLEWMDFSGRRIFSLCVTIHTTIDFLT